MTKGQFLGFDEVSKSTTNDNRVCLKKLDVRVDLLQPLYIDVKKNNKEFPNHAK